MDFPGAGAHGLTEEKLARGWPPEKGAVVWVEMEWEWLGVSVGVENDFGL